MKLALFFGVLFLTTSCSHLLYQPTSQMYYPPEKMNIKHEELAIPVDENTKVHAWLLKGEKRPSKGLLIFFHGNAQNLTAHYAALAWILKEGYDYLIWDYRGYGISEGEPTPKNTVQDGVKVIEYVLEKFPRERIFIFGQSLGGAVAMRSLIELKDKTRIQGIVVDSTFSSYQSVSRSILAKSFITWLFQPLAYVLMSDKWAPEGRIGEISPIPLAIIHGKKDQIINYEFGEEIFTEAKEPKYFWPVENGTHIDSFFGHNFEFRKKLLAFLQ